MTPEELIKEEQKLEEHKKIYPPFLVEQLRKGREEIRKNLPQSFVKITDFTQVILTTWVISSKSYQKNFWADHRKWWDNYSETMEIFLSNTEAVLDTSDYAVEMTLKQREMLQKLYDMMEDYEGDPDAADDPGYGINDAEIIEDPKFDKCRKYARLVYEELSGDDLDAWEKEKNSGD
ncbi:MAG: hypothetical protein AAGE99_04000 [Chlamydiota bacterium]